MSRLIIAIAPLIAAPTLPVPFCPGEPKYIPPIMIDYDVGPGARCRWDEVFEFDGMATECRKR